MVKPRQLTETWPGTTLGEAVEFLDHLRKPITASERKAGPYPYYGANGQQDSVADYIFDEPLILLAEDGGHFDDPSRGIAYAVTGKCWVNNHAHVLRPRSSFDLHFLKWHLAHYDLSGFVNGTTRGKLTKASAERIPLIKPPLPKQRRIADILDKADAIRRKRKQAIALTEELLRSTFLEMFGDPVTNPKGWPVELLGKLAEVNRGKFSPRPRNDPRFYGGSFPFIQTGELRNACGFLRTWRQTLNHEGRAVSRGFKRGTVAISIAANIGDTALVDFDFFCPDSVVGIEPKDGYTTAEFLEFTLRFFQPQLLKQAPETAQKNINLEALRPLELPNPPIQSQHRFSSIYRATYHLSHKMESSATGQQELFASLVHRAFSGILTP